MKYIKKFEINIEYKKGDYIMIDNVIQKITSSGIIGTVTSGINKGKKCYGFWYYNPLTYENDSKSLLEDEVILPTKKELKELEMSLDAIKQSKKYNL